MPIKFINDILINKDTQTNANNGLEVANNVLVEGSLKVDNAVNINGGSSYITAGTTSATLGLSADGNIDLTAGSYIQIGAPIITLSNILSTVTGAQNIIVRQNNGELGVIPSSSFTTAFTGTGLVKSIAGAVSYIADNSSNWDSAYVYSQVGHIPLSQIGAPNGVVPLVLSKIPAMYLPAYVDDVLEYTNLAAFPVTGETSIIYVTIDTNKSYRWSGSSYIEVSPSDVNSVNGRTGIVNLDDTYVNLTTTQNVGGIKSFSSDVNITGNSGLFFWNTANTNWTSLHALTPANHIINLPAQSGTIALVSDIPTFGTSARTLTTFTATEGQTTFTLPLGYAAGLVDIFVNGVKLTTTEFTASNGSTVIITNGVRLNDVVEIINYNTAVTSDGVLRAVSTFIATAAQTSFTLDYTPGLIDVYYNGSKLTASEYTALNGTTVVLNAGCVVGDIVEIVAFNYGFGGVIPPENVGTINTISKFTSTNTLGNSSISDNGTNVTFAIPIIGTSGSLSSIDFDNVVTLTTNPLNDSFLIKGATDAIMMEISNVTLVEETIPIGYAMEGGITTGGAGGTEITVTTEAALRAALTGSTPKIVYFNGSLTYSGAIPAVGANMIDVGSNTTLIGINNAVLNGFGLAMYGKENIIIKKMRINKVRGADCIIIKELTHHVWIDKCELWGDRAISADWEYYDELIDISDRANYVTISNTIFNDSHKGILIGSHDLATTDIGYLKVTVYKNYFLNCSERQPMSRFGFVHAFNNYHLHTNGYASGYTYGVTGNGTLRTDNNYLDGQNIPFFSGFNENLAAGFSGIDTNIILNSGANQLAGSPIITWVPPYTYASALLPAASVPAYVLTNAGPNGATGGESGSAVFDFILNGGVTVNGTLNTAGAVTVGTTLTADAIGIGTTPISPIHISNAGGTGNGITIQSSNAASYSTVELKNNLNEITEIIGTGSTFAWNVYTPSTSYITNSVGGVGLIAGGAAGVITFATGGNLVANISQRIFANGNIMMGYNDDQGYQLAVNGPVYGSSYAYFEGAIQGGSIAKIGGTQHQFMKADGSVDGKFYLPLTATSSYPLTGDLYGTGAVFTGTISNVANSETGNYGAAFYNLHSGGYGTIIRGGNGAQYSLLVQNYNATISPMVVLGNGNTTIAGTFTVDGGQIKFPATQVPSADVNTLDDYEEGSWTPTAIFSGGNGDLSYSFQVGSYVKIGKLVTCVAYLLFGESTASGNLTIGGLPFTAMINGSQIQRFGVGVDNLTGISGMPTAELGGGGSTLTMSYTGTGTASAITAANTSSNAVFRMSFSYITTN